MKRILCFLASSLFISANTFAEDVKEQLEVKETNVEVTTKAPEMTSGETEKTKVEQLLSKLPKISGYLQTGWNYTSQGEGKSSFQAKRLRLLMDGYVMKNVSFRLQIEAFNGIAGSTNGNGQKNIQVMDAFATAKLSNSLNIRAGQYYLPIGFENYDISPATLETVDFSNICYRMVCRNPISYNIVDYGRDLGIMIFGDLLPSKDKDFNHLSYFLSVSNGSIPMKDDNNKSKDIVGAIEYRPIKYLMFKGAYNRGEYATSIGGVGNFKYKEMNRYVLGAWYNDPNGLDARAEYGHIQAKNAVKEDGFYALAAYHINNWLPVVRYDFYRDKENRTTLNNYDRMLVGCSYQFSKNLKLQANYGYSVYTKEAREVSNHGKKGSSQIQIMALYKF